MLPTRLRWAAAALFVCGLSFAMLQLASLASARAATPPEWIVVSAHVKGRLILVGRELRAGDMAAHERKIMILQDPIQVYYRLREGDRVENGDLLGRIDDREARQEVEAKAANVKAAEAGLIANEKTCEEAKTRYERMKRLEAACGSVEELSGAKLALDCYVEEAKVKLAHLKIARLEVEQANLQLQMCEIRSPVRGTIQTILKKQGDPVGELEGIFRIRIDEN